MSNTSGSGNDYTDPHTHSFATESAAAPAPKKPNPIIKVVIIVFGLFMLVATGMVLWGFLKPKPVHAPAAQTQAAKPTPKPAEAPAAVEPPPVETVVDPNAAVVDPNAAPLNPNAVPVTDPNAALTPNAVPVDATGAVPAPVSVVDPNAPVVPAVDPNAPVTVTPAPATTQAPAPAVVAPPAAVETPATTPAPPVAVVQDPANSSVSQVMDTARQEMMSALDRIEKRLTEMDGRFASLEGRVSSLEGRPASAAAPRVASKPVARRHVARKPAVRRVARPQVEPSQNRIEILDGSIAPVSRVIIDPGYAPAAVDGNRVEVIQAPVSTSSRSSASCRIQSIKPGRVWVRRADGSFATFGVGDILPNGARADSIDPDTGVMAGGRLWSCG